MELFKRFDEVFGVGEVPRVFVAGGRVNIIGEHIDYNGGYVFPAAIGLSCKIYSRLNGTDKLNIAFTTTEFRGSIDTKNLDAYKTAKYINYQAGVCSVLAGEGIEICGADLLYDIDVPFGSGLSSSAAIEVATAYMLTVYHNEKHGIEEIDPVKIAILSRRAENEYVGVNCGIMDQFASACGKADHAIRLNCATLDYEYVPLKLNDYSLVIINTNKPHSLVESKYNERRAECEAALKILQGKLAVAHLCDITPQQFNTMEHLLEGTLLARAKHCINEQARVNMAVEAMRAGDIVLLGKILREGHESLRSLYEVSCVELDTIADFANAFDGCAGARMTGAGFGGSCVAIVKTDIRDEFETRLAEHYKMTTGLTAGIYNTCIADGARELVHSKKS